MRMFSVSVNSLSAATAALQPTVVHLQHTLQVQVCRGTCLPTTSLWEVLRLNKHWHDCMCIGTAAHNKGPIVTHDSYSSVKSCLLLLILSHVLHKSATKPYSTPSEDSTRLTSSAALLNTAFSPTDHQVQLVIGTGPTGQIQGLCAAWGMLLRSPACSS